jgi:hypothetical protein
MTCDFGILWRVSFRAETRDLLKSQSPRVIDALASSPFWNDLNVRATWNHRADDIGEPQPLGTTTSIKKLVKSGESVYLGRDHVSRDADLRFEIGTSPSGMMR